MATFQKNNQSYEAKESSLHGRGLFSTRRICAQDTVFVESPLVAMQTLSNRREVVACGACFGPLSISPQLQLSILSGSSSPLEISERSDICSCQRKCGEIYCCEECRDKAWAASHSLLCVGDILEEEAEAHPLIQLKILAITSNEILLLAVNVVAEMVLRHESLEAQGTSFETYAMAPFKEFVRKPWWEVAKASPGSDASELRGSLMELCEKTAKLLRESLGACPGGTREGLEASINAELVGSIIGTFEQNNVGVRCRSPLRPWADKMAINAAKGDLEELLSVGQHLQTLASQFNDESEEEGEDGGGGGEEVDVPGLIELIQTTCDDEVDPLFTPLDGTALFSTACVMNHSCSPNILIVFEDAPEATSRTAPLTLRVMALRDIPPGEELCFSYIPADLAVAERKLALAEYDIVCTCPLCVEEVGDSKGAQEDHQ